MGILNTIGLPLITLNNIYKREGFFERIIYFMTQKQQTVLVTHEGLEKIQKEYKYLVEKKLPSVVERISKARELGDLADNSEYSAAREELDLIETRISELKKTLDKTKIISLKTNTDFVTIGSTIEVEFDGEIDKFTIVGSLEADPVNKKISNESPVGKALLGAKVGEIVEVATTIVKYKYKIIEIK